MFWGSKTAEGDPMSKEERVEMYRGFLRGEGYVPEDGPDGHLVFKVEGRTYLIIVDEADEDFFRIVFPNFWSVENEEDRVKIEGAALHATAGTKVAKVFPVRDNVWATIEIFCSPPEGFKTVFQRSMSALRAGVATFAEKMREE
jgi:hypothetical protein